MTRPDRTQESLDAGLARVADQDPPVVRAALDRDVIVAAALSYIDESGLAGLTMRRLATLLGVEAMSLYSHIDSKESLLDGVVESLTSDMRGDDAVPWEPTDGWQDFLQRLAHGVRRVALAHPKAFPLVASRPPDAPWLRPPLRSLEWVEAFLLGLGIEGFSDEAVVAGYRAFSSFLLGHLLLEVSAHGADINPLDVVNDETHQVKSFADFPTVHRLRTNLAHDHAAVDFEEALEELLVRMTLMRSEAGPATRAGA